MSTINRGMFAFQKGSTNFSVLAFLWCKGCNWATLKAFQEQSCRNITSYAVPDPVDSLMIAHTHARKEGSCRKIYPCNLMGEGKSSFPVLIPCPMYTYTGNSNGV